MLPEPWRDLSDETSAALVEAYRSVCGAEAADRLACALRSGADRLDAGTSRQAQHARTQRMLITSQAACAMHALEQPSFASIFQRADFAALRPNSADAHRRFGELMQSRGLREPKIPMAWAHQAEVFLALAARAPTSSREELSIMHATLVPLFACAIVGGPALAEAWRTVWRQAMQRDVLRNPGVRVHLSGLGCFVGEAAPAFDVQVDPTLRAVNFSTVLCLVRRDDTRDLRDRIASIMRGDDVTPADCLYPSRPASTIARAAEYVRGQMRNPLHFSNVGLILTLLSWTSELSRFVDIRRDEWSSEIEPLLRELARIEQVQVLEKTRFWRVLETVPTGSHRDHLLALWTRTHESVASS